MADNKKYITKGKSRLIALIALTAILVVMLFSSYFIIKEANHDCSGVSCPVCAVIQQCEDNLSQISSGSAAVIAALAVVCFFIHTVYSTSSVVLTETLITRKVRLNN